MKIEIVFLNDGIRKCRGNKYGLGLNYLIYSKYTLINQDVIKKHRQLKRYERIGYYR